MIIIKKFFCFFGIFSLILITFIQLFVHISFENAIPILAYHDVVESPLNDTDISIENFEKQMKYLHENGFKSLSLDEFYEWKKGKKIGGRKVIITFDDGKDSYYNIVAPIMKKYNLNATLFLVGERKNQPGYLNDEQIDDIEENYPNMEIESHTYALHTRDKANSNDYDIYVNDLALNEKEKYKFFAYPFGITNNEYKKALKDNNYKLAFLYAPGKWASREQNDYAVYRVPVYNSTSFLKFKLKVWLNVK